MKTDVLVAEIGSTTTVVNAFSGIKSGEPEFIGQGQAYTTVTEGDVNIGLKNAVESLRKNLGEKDIIWDEMFATSSAAGGLRMSVHGLVYDMTVRAGREAALGAGAVIKFVTAGRLRSPDIRKVKEISPNLILVAGGVDYGERDTAIYNYEALMKAGCSGIPVIYAGNIENREEIAELAEEYGGKVYFSENVYPRIDSLNIEPTRKIVHQAFEEHIMRSPGMQDIQKLITGPMIPTPGAVMESAQLLYGLLGDLMVLDVGGATTDLHSVTEGAEEIKRIMLAPEPFAKRTVEGDLGVYVNREHVVAHIGIEELKKEFPDAEKIVSTLHPIPVDDIERAFVERLTVEACKTAMARHAGKLTDLYGPTGKKTVASGKDLSAVRYIIGTGGALTRLPHRAEILKGIVSEKPGAMLYPNADASVLIDNDYIMASAGVLSLRYPEQAGVLLRKSLAV